VTALLPAAALPACRPSGHGNSFQAYSLDAGPNGSTGDFSVSVPLVTSGLGPGSKSDYYGPHGPYIFDATGKLEFYYLTIHDGISPRVIVVMGSKLWST